MTIEKYDSVRDRSELSELLGGNEGLQKRFLKAVEKDNEETIVARMGEASKGFSR